MALEYLLVIAASLVVVCDASRSVFSTQCPPSCAVCIHRPSSQSTECLVSATTETVWRVQFTSVNETQETLELDPFFTLLPHIEHLHVDGSELLRLELSSQALRSFSQLQTLVLQRLELINWSYVAFPPLDQMQSLQIVDCHVDGMPLIPSAASLVELDLRNNALRAIPSLVYSALDQLQVLRLRGNGIQQLQLSQAEFDRLAMLQVLDMDETALAASNCPLVSMPSYAQRRICAPTDSPPAHSSSSSSPSLGVVSVVMIVLGVLMVISSVIVLIRRRKRRPSTIRLSSDTSIKHDGSFYVDMQAVKVDQKDLQTI